MKCFVRDNPMTWSVIGLVCATAAERLGPTAGGLYLLALGLAAIAVMHVIAPNLLPGSKGERDEKGAR
jgi:membrane protein implicated in regulation of membrane protease activity